MTRTARAVDAGPFRLAQVAPSLAGGGLERLVRDLTLRLDRDRFTPAVFTVAGLGTYTAELREAGVEVHDCTEPRIRVRGVPGRLIRRLRAFAPHVIHSHSGTWFPSVVARKLVPGAALLHTDHGRYPPEPWGRSLVERWCHRNSDLVVAVSGSLAEYLKAYLRLDAPPPVFMNGVDLAAFAGVDPGARSRLRAEWALPPGATVVVSVGRLAAVKNLDGLLRAVAATGLPDLQVLLVGEGEDAPGLRRLARELDIADRVVFAGFRPDVAACLAAADLYALPSHTEGTPLSLIEALAAGLPVVASAVGGVPHVLGDPQAGLAVPAGDGTALAEALSRLARDRGLREELSERASERARAFGLEAFTRRYVEAYLRLIGRRRR